MIMLKSGLDVFVDFVFRESEVQVVKRVLEGAFNEVQNRIQGPEGQASHQIRLDSLD